MSFGQEIKDFLAAGTSTYKTINDAEYNKLKGKYLQAQIDQLDDPEGDKLALEGKQLQNQALRQRIATSAQAAKANSQAIPTSPIVGSAGAGMSGTGDATEVPVIPPQGGIGHYAGGGLAEPLPMQARAPQGPIAQAIPTGAPTPEADDEEDDDIPAPAVGSTDMSARRRKAPEGLDAGLDAASQGLIENTRRVSRAGATGPQRQRALQLYAQGYGAVTPEDMQALYKKVDPNNKLSAGERNIAALGTIWKYKIAQNDLAGARSAAADMMQHYKLMSQRYAAIAATAAQHGDLDGAAKATMAAYSQIPDGRDLKVVKTPEGSFKYEFTDIKTGKKMQSGIASPQELTAAAMGVATKGFEQTLLQAAGDRHAEQGAVGGKSSGGGAPKQSDLKAIREGVSEHVDQFAEANKITDKGQISQLKNSTTYIAQENPKITPSDAFDAAKTIIASPAPKKGEDLPFKVERDEESKRNKVTFRDSGRSIELPDNEMQALMVARGKALKDRSKDEKPEGGKSYGDYAADAGNALGAIASDAGRAAKAGGEAIGGAIGRGASAVGGALENPALASSGRNALRAVQNPGDNPGVDSPL